MNIKDGAIFIADSHYNDKRTVLYDMLNDIKSKKIYTTQLFLMGDLFDFLSYEIEYFKNINSQVIDIINDLSESIEVIYFEGNHDFNLEQIFPKIYVIPREQQPLEIQQNDKNISLSHGDIFTPTGYNIFSAILRNHYFQNLINFIDKNNWLSKRVEEKLLSKDICHEQDDFIEFVENRIYNYNTDLIIEGHFHQGYQDDKYINLPSLACTEEYTIFKNNQFSFNSL